MEWPEQMVLFQEQGKYLMVEKISFFSKKHGEKSENDPFIYIINYFEISITMILGKKDFVEKQFNTLLLYWGW